MKRLPSRPRLDGLFDIEREISGLSAAARYCVRQERSAPLMEDLHAWLIAQLAKLSRNHDLAKAINYMLLPMAGVYPLSRRWQGRHYEQCSATGPALRAARPQGLAVLWLGSRRPACRRLTLIGTAKLNNVDQQAWLSAQLA